MRINSPMRNFFETVGKPTYLTLWVISYVSREQIEKCEIMVKMVCEASLLEASDTRLNKKQWRVGSETNST